MDLAPQKTYLFDEFRFEPDRRLLTYRHGENGDRIPLANLPFRVLLHLIENRHKIVSRQELLDEFWSGREVYDEALTKCIGTIRKALSDHAHGNPRFIETCWTGGYRFIGNVEEIEAASYEETLRSREVKIVIEETDGGACELAEAAIDLPVPISRPETDRKLGRSPAFRVITGLRLLRTAAIIGCSILGLGLVVSLFYFYAPSDAGGSRPNSIAVLPLKNLSNNVEDEIFSEGMTDSLISSLSRIDGLKVVSRSSSFAFKNKDSSHSEIAARLGVTSFIEGSVRNSGSLIRVDVRLVNAGSGEVMWTSDAYERPLGDIFEIQDDIARSVATRLRLNLTQAADQRLTKRQTGNVEAYQAFIKGRYFWKKKDAENLEKARRFLEEAIRLDPNYALAYAALADYHLSGIWYADFPPQESLKRAKDLLQNVSEIDDRLPEAHGTRARIAATEWDWETCRKEFEKALELNANDANYWQGYAFVLRNLDERFDEAVNAVTRAQELDPLSVSISTDVGVMLLHAGRDDEAIEIFKKTFETDPNFSDAHWNLGLAYLRKQMNAEAAAAFIESERLKGKSEERLSEYRAAFEQGGMNGFWQNWLESLVEDAKEKSLSAYVMAAFHARAGKNGLALEWLEKSFAAREPHLVNLKIEMAFDGLRSDIRFTNLVRRVGLEK